MTDSRLSPTPILVNGYEKRVDGLLQETLGGHGVRLLAKVRVADTLDVQSLRGSLKTYALSAHLDFVAVDEDSLPLFAVEFDGRNHFADPDVRHRDAMKDDLCEDAGLPLLRVTSEYFAHAAQTTVLQYAVEAYFLSEAFLEAQQQGYVPWDEPFDPGMFFRRTSTGQFVFNSLDAEARLFLQGYWERKLLPSFCPAVVTIEDHSERSLTAWAYLAVERGRFLVERVRVRDCRFQGIGPHTIAEELAVVALVDQARRWVDQVEDPVAYDWAKMRAVFDVIQTAIDAGLCLGVMGTSGLEGAGPLPAGLEPPHHSWSARN